MRKVGKRPVRPNVGPPKEQAPPPPPINYADQALKNQNFSIVNQGGSPMDMQNQSIPSLNEISTKVQNFSIDMDQSIIKDAYAEEQEEEVDREDLADTSFNAQDVIDSTRPWEQEGSQAQQVLENMEAQKATEENVIIAPSSATPDWRADVEAKQTEQGVVYYKHPKTGAVLVNSANLENNPELASEWWENEYAKDTTVTGTSITSMKSDGLGTSNYGQTRFGEEGLIDQIAQQKQYQNEGVVKRQIMEDIGTEGFGYSSPGGQLDPYQLALAKQDEATKAYNILNPSQLSPLANPSDTKGSDGENLFSNKDYAYSLAKEGGPGWVPTEYNKAQNIDPFKIQPTTPISRGNKSEPPIPKGEKSGNLWLGNIPGGKKGTVPDLVNFYKQNLKDKSKRSQFGLDESFGQMNTKFLDQMQDRWTFKTEKKPKVKKPKETIFETERDNFGGSGALYDPTGFYSQ